MKTVGIIGGLGPLAGSHFYRRIIELTPAMRDEEHIPVVLISDPCIPSRIEHLNGTGESPVPRLREVCRRLVGSGAEIIALPSSTTSVYHSELVRATEVPLLSLIDEVARCLQADGVKVVGLLGTTPTRVFGIYEAQLAKRGITPVYPDALSQQEVMDVIKEVKGFRRDSRRGIGQLRASIMEVSAKSWADSADAILLACTELPVLFTSFVGEEVCGTHRRFYSSTDILASSVIRQAFSHVKNAVNR